MRDEYIIIRTNAVEKAVLRERAREHGMSMSAYVRWLVLKSTKGSAGKGSGGNNESC